DEPDETFVVNLTGAANAVIADAQGSGLIVDDDVPGPAGLVAAYNFNGGSGPAPPTCPRATIPASCPERRGSTGGPARGCHSMASMTWLRSPTPTRSTSRPG